MVSKSSFLVKSQQKLIDSAVLSIQKVFLQKESELLIYVFFQGKSGEVAICEFDSQNQAFITKLYKKTPELVGFKKLKLNEILWKKEEGDTYLQIEDQIKNELVFNFYSVDNDENQITNFTFDLESFKKNSFFFQAKENIKLKSTCFIEAVTLQNINQIREFVLIGEEDIGIILGTKSKSNFELSLIWPIKQGYIFDIKLISIEEIENKTKGSLFYGTNATENVLMEFDFASKKILSSKRFDIDTFKISGITNIRLYNENKYLLISTLDKKVCMLRRKDLKMLFGLSLHDKYINDISIIENEASKYIVSCGDDGYICFLDLATLKTKKSGDL